MLRRTRVAATIVAVVGLVALGVTGTVADEYPSWDDVLEARGDEVAARAAISEIERILLSLEAEAAELGKIALLRDEEYHQAAFALEEATASAHRLDARASEAEERSKQSARRAGQLIAQLARVGGGNPTLEVLSHSNTDDLLGALGTMDKVSEHNAAIYDQAILDHNLAESLSGQARAAQADRDTLAAVAAAARTEAQLAADAATAQVLQEQASASQMYEQLAILRGTTAAIERGYVDGLVRERERAVRPPAPTAPAADPGPSGGAGSGSSGDSRSSGPGSSGSGSSGAGGDSSGGSSSSGSSGSDSSGGGSSSGGSSGPGSSGSGSSSGADSGGSGPTQPQPPPPSGGAAAGAIAFAYAQIGEPYLFAGSGPDAWDCSGLTKAAYASVGIHIGAHLVSSQYNTMAAAGRLVPISEMAPGDLIYYADDGTPDGGFYHVSLYVGDGMMIEAPRPGVAVRVTGVRYYDVLSHVGRPA